MSKISFTHFESMAKEIGWSEIKSLLTIFLHNFAIFALICLSEENVSKNCFTYFGSTAKLDDPRSKILILQFSKNYSTKRRVFKLIFIHSLETNIMNNGESFSYATHVTLNSHVGKLYSTQVKCHADYRKKVQLLRI